MRGFSGMKIIIVTSCLLGFSLAKAIVEDFDYTKGSYNEDYYSTDQHYMETVENFSIPGDKPPFVSNGGDFIISEKSTFLLFCQFNDLGVDQMIWLKRPGMKGAEDILYQGQREVTKSSRRSLTQLENNRGTLLTISPTIQEDAGTYICKIATPSNDQMLEFHVSIGDSHPSQGVNLKGGALGIEYPRWKETDQILGGSNRDYYTTDQDYMETVENVKIPVDNPHFVSSGADFIIGEKSELVLTCQVKDLGVHQMIWLKSPGLKGAEDILYLGQMEVTKSSRRSLAQIENNQGTILTIKKATYEDAGTYICKIATPSYDQMLEFHVSIGDSHPSWQYVFRAVSDHVAT